ncbi:MAG: translocation/assembly module TamB domain-containing protein [Nitrospirae bacterium]|nr:translocation/assembly module TamB domain-containing protein [Nitrospirota bacterium]MBF0534344.1 translocation/assembly module TamB domain-containing protein [Nitrospirota bacterium]MBF0615675.1 translocation/assembly module TamB domain-containing protein [Nitrospirota bacterium]
MDENIDIKIKSYKRLVICLLAFFTLLLVTHIIGSAYLKDKLILEIKKTLGPDVEVKDMYIKVFPPHIGINELTVKDEFGKTVLHISDAVFHIRLIPLLSKKIVIQRAFIDNPSVDLDSEYIKTIAKRLKKGSGGNTPEIISFLLKDVRVNVSDKDRNASLSLKEIKGHLDTRRTELSLKDINLNYSGFKGVLAAVPFINSITISGKPLDSGFELSEFRLENQGVDVKLTGVIDSKKNVHLRTDSSLKLNYIKTLFGLKNPGKGHLKLTGSMDYVDKAVSLNLDVDGHLWIETFLELIRQREPIMGETVFKGNIQGPLKTLTAHGTASMQHGGQFYGIDVDNLTSSIVYKDYKLKFYDASGNLYNGTATHAEVVLNMPVVNYFTLDVEAKDVDSSPIFKLIHWDPGLSPGKTTGKVHHAGRYFSPDATFRYVRQAPANGEPDNKDVIKRVDEVTGDVKVADENVTITNVKVKTKLSTGTINGTYNMKDKTINLALATSTKDAADFTRPFSEDLRGMGTFTGVVTGIGSDPNVSGTIALSSGSIFGYAFNYMNTKADYNMKKLVLSEGASTTYGGKCQFGGITEFKDPAYLFDLSKPTLNMAFAFNNIDLDNLTKKYLEIDNLGGNLKGEFDVKGKADNLKYTGAASVSSLSYKGISAGAAQTKFAYNKGRITLRGFSVKKGSSELSLDGSIAKRGQNWMDKRNFSYDIASSKCRLNAKDIPFSEKLGDTYSECSIKMTGTVLNPDLTFEGTVKSTEYPALKGKISVLAKKHEAFLTGNLFDNKLGLTGHVNMTGNNAWSLHSQFKHGNYEWIVSKLAKATMPHDLKLVLTGETSLSGNNKTVSGRVVLSELNLSGYRYNVSNNGNIDFSLNDNKFTINSCRLNAGGSGFKITGDIEAGKRYNLAITGQPELNLLKSESEKISWLNGKADIALAVTGEWAKPQISGGFNISNGSLGIKGFRYFLSNIESDIYFESNRVVVKKLSTKIGGGAITASGVGYMDGFNMKKFYIDGVAENVPANMGEGFTMKFGGLFLYSGNLKKQTLSGDLNVSAARYTKSLYWQDLIFEKTSSASQVNPFLKNLEFNVNVTGDKNIVIDNNVAESNVKLDLQLKGDVTKPVIYGRMSATGGKLFFKDNEFRLQTANIDFAGTPDINPYINIVSESTVKNYNVKLMMSGQLKRFDLSLSSTPPLKEAAILALFTGSGGSKGATSILAAKYQGLIEERIKNITGLNRVDVVPYDEKISLTPQITVSKKLLDDNLNVTLTSGVTKGEIIKVEYKLKKGVSLVGERNEHGNVGGDVKFRFEFK